MLSLGIFCPLAFKTAIRNCAFIDGSLMPPSFTATVISFDNLEKMLDLFASSAPFFLLIFDHLLCPDIYYDFTMAANLVNQSNLFQKQKSGFWFYCKFPLLCIVFFSKDGSGWHLNIKYNQ